MELGTSWPTRDWFPADQYLGGLHFSPGSKKRTGSFVNGGPVLVKIKEEKKREGEGGNCWEVLRCETVLEMVKTSKFCIQHSFGTIVPASNWRLPIATIILVVAF